MGGQLAGRAGGVHICRSARAGQEVRQRAQEKRGEERRHGDGIHAHGHGAGGGVSGVRAHR